MKGLFFVFLISTSLVTQKWIVDAVPSNALILRPTRDVTTGSSAFGDLSSNDTSISISLEPNMPWEDFILPAPTVIALLGQLMVISGKIDFSLTANTPRGGFKYMRHPESFRASLVQVSNDGWSAFMNAHENMDRIQLYMQQVPVQVKTAIKILAQASPRLVGSLLPITLTHIQEIGEQCVKLSTETALKFTDVMLLLGELLEVTESSKGTHEQQLSEVIIELNVTTAQKKELDQMGQELQKRQQQIDQQVANYRSQYDQALKDIPTGWNALAQDLFRAAINIVNNVLPGILGVGGKVSGGGGGGAGGIGGGYSAPDVEKSSIFSLVGNFFNQVGSIKNAIGQIFHNKGSASKGNPSSLFSSFSTIIKSYENMMKNMGESDVKNQALGFLSDGKQVCSNLEQMFANFPDKNLTAKDEEYATKSIDDLSDKMSMMATQGSKLSNGMATGQTSTGVQIAGGDYSGTGGNERYKAAVALARLRDEEARSDQIFGEMMKYHEEMKDLVGKMAKLNLEEINFKAILELLKQGIQMLGKIKEQWGKLVLFFKLVSVRAEVALNQTLVPFVQYAEQAEKIPGGMTKDERVFFLGLLEDQAVDINKVAYFLYTLSSTYFDVSTKFLMNRLAGLAQMLATDDEAGRQRLLKQLSDQANEASDAIKVMAQQRRLQYTRLVDARKRELDDMIKKLGGPSEADTKAIQAVYGKQ